MDVFRVCCIPNLLRQFKFLSLVRNGFGKEIPDRMEEMKNKMLSACLNICHDAKRL